MTLLPGASVGKYVVRRKLAEGGMAEIYLCTFKGPEGFEKEVVIKRVRPALADDPMFVQMFISEARVASKLNHANLVHIFDFDKHEDTYYLAMEYVRGRSLWELRKRCKELLVPIPPTLAAEMGAQVARGLSYAHRLTDRSVPLNLVHRDVTPHNVLLSYDGAVKLTDFGIAKAGNRLTASGMLKGKFAYMAPEQARGERVDARSDLFALGIVLWELVTGGRLFDGDSDLAVLKAVQDRAIPRPSRLNEDVPEALSAAIMRALERNPAARFQTAQEFERALANHVLASARTVEDTDVGAFVRRVFANAGQTPDALLERTGSAPVPSSPNGATQDAFALSTTVPRGEPLSEDDPHAGTRLLGRPKASLADQTTDRRAAPIRRRPGARLWVGLAATSLVAPLALVFLWMRTPRPKGEERAPAPLTTVLVQAAPAEPDAGSALHLPATSGTGRVVLKAFRWAKVVVDGKPPVEVEGRLTLDLSAGDHHIQDVKSGHVYPVHLDKGETRVLDLRAPRISNSSGVREDPTLAPNPRTK